MCVYTELLCKPRAPARSPIEVPWYPFWAKCLAASFDRRSLVDANSNELPYATSTADGDAKQATERSDGNTASARDRSKLPEPAFSPTERSDAMLARA